MTDLTTLQSLRDRVAQATGPDREIDAAIACAFVLRDLRPARPDDFEGRYGYPPGSIKTTLGFLQADSYTSSIDAALAWVERVLPGWGWTVSNADDVKPCPKAWVWELSAENRAEHFSANAPTPALAIILAGLDALIAKESPL